MDRLYSSTFCPAQPLYTARHLPQEITDMIIDFLHHDIPSLRACALVSHSWLHPSRFHLFRSCTIGNPNRFEATFRVITTSPDVGTYVLQLTIVGESIHDFTFGRFKTLLRGLPRLRLLDLQKVTFGQNGDTGRAHRYHSKVDHPNGTSLPQDTQRRHAGLFALQELRLLECDATTDNYAHLFHLLGLFSSIQTLFLASNLKARRNYVERHLPDWVLEPMRVAVQHLHTFNVPFPIVETLLATLGAANASALHTFWYDDNDAPDWAVGAGSAIDKFRTMMMASSPPRLQCLILGPLPIFEDPLWFERGGVVQLQLASLRGLRTFHLRGRRLEPHLAGVFTALPDTVREARFVVVGVSAGNGERTWNRFREFAQAFEGELARRTRMTFVLDLGVAKRRLPPQERFGVLRDRAEKGLVRLAMLGRLLIDDSPKER